MAHAKKTAGPTARELQFVEDAALVYEQMGLPRMAGRIMGWLLICEPAHQSLPELGERLQASKGSISTMTRLLIAGGIVQRLTLPGDRRDYVRIPPDLPSSTIHEMVGRIQVVRGLVERGLDAISGAPPARTARLREMHGMYVFLEKEAAQLIRRWDLHKKAPSAAKKPRAARRS